MLVTCQEMADAEDRLFATGAEAEPLMEKAGLGCAQVIRDFFPHPARAIVFCGKGNNGGDALVIGRWLRKWGWRVEVNLSHSPDEMTDLARRKLEELSGVADGPAPLSHRTILIDGLLGIGAKGPLRGSIGSSAEWLHRLREQENAHTFAVDIPSGLDGDTGEAYEGAVVADTTLSICAPKKGIAADRAIGNVGRIAEILLPEIPVESESDSPRLLFPSNLRPRLPRRDFDFHKGKAGRVAIVAGSRGLTGAPVLSALGASHAGAGLTSVFVPEDIYPIVAAQAPPEVMVRGFSTISDVSDFEADVFAIGPGLGKEVAARFLDFITDDSRPIVVDADALNALGENRERLLRFPSGKRLLTPHPGELKRLTDQTGERISLTEKLADEWNATLLHKGSRTVVATPGHPTELNTTGHPGMASGGMGDVLTGICAALIGQGIGLHDAACLSSWLIGRAAELAVRDLQIAEKSVTAPMMANHLGRALAELGI